MPREVHTIVTKSGEIEKVTTPGYGILIESPELIDEDLRKFAATPQGQRHLSVLDRVDRIDKEKERDERIKMENKSLREWYNEQPVVCYLCEEIIKHRSDAVQDGDKYRHPDCD